MLIDMVKRIVGKNPNWQRDIPFEKRGDAVDATYGKKLVAEQPEGRPKTPVRSSSFDSFHLDRRRLPVNEPTGLGMIEPPHASTEPSAFVLASVLVVSLMFGIYILVRACSVRPKRAPR